MTAPPSERERIAHVVRRLSMGPHPDRLDRLGSVDEAIGAAFSTGDPSPMAPVPDPPADAKSGRDPQVIGSAITWWFERMITPSRPIEERLIWFWHDHFATSLAKVKVPYLMVRQHHTIRALATGSFADLLGAIATDPAMLIYLDGAKSSVKQRNENFGRECLELFTMGRTGGYTQDDVVAASRAFTGWVIDVPGTKWSGIAAAPWQSAFVPRRHDDAEVTLFGRSAAFDLPGALEVILEQPATPRFIAAKLFRELVGLEPDGTTLDALAAGFAADWQILALAKAITATPAFRSDAAVRAKFRSPVERTVAIAQAAGASTVALGRVARRAKAGSLAGALQAMSALPFVPPNVAGFPKGPRLAGPGELTRHVELLGALPSAPPVPAGDDALLARFGLFDVSTETRAALAAERDPARRFALVATCPEFALA